MSNRKITQGKRMMRFFRPRSGTPVIRTDGNGNVRRGEGRNNFAYGPLTTSPSILTLHRQAERPRRDYGSRTGGGTNDERRAALEAMTRDELRAVCKAQSVTGYGKMNKAQLIEAALR